MQLSRRCSHLFGISVDSELDLDLPLVSKPGQVEVVFGTVAEEGEPIFQTNDPMPFACYRQGDAVVLGWEHVRFRIIPEQVIVDADDPVAAAQLLIPAAWSVVLAARGQEALHGAAVEWNGQAIAILGYSGSGKTTAALKLIEAGGALITDDLLTFDPCLNVLPGPPWMRLAPCPGHDDAGDLDTGGKRRAYPPVCPVPRPLSALVIMAPEYGQIARLSGIAAAAALLQQVYNPVVTHPDQVQRRFQLVHDLVDRVPMYAAAPRSLSTECLRRLSQERVA